MTPDEKRAAAAERKRRSRANLAPLEIPLPQGTRAALDRICAAAADSPKALLSQQIHKLDQLLTASPEAFVAWVRYGTVVGDLSKFIDRIGANPDD